LWLRRTRDALKQIVVFVVLRVVDVAEWRGRLAAHLDAAIATIHTIRIGINMTLPSEMRARNAPSRNASSSLRAQEMLCHVSSKLIATKMLSA